MLFRRNWRLDCPIVEVVDIALVNEFAHSILLLSLGLTPQVVNPDILQIVSVRRHRLHLRVVLLLKAQCRELSRTKHTSPGVARLLRSLRMILRHHNSKLRLHLVVTRTGRR